jgi:peroxiredoxin
MRPRLSSIALVFILVACTARGAAADAGTPWLGVLLGKGKVGTRITEVIPDMPGARAGLKPGDEVVALGGDRTPGPPELKAAVARHRSGARVALSVVRDGRALTIDATLAPRPDEQTLLRKRLIDRPALPFDLPVVTGTAAGALGELAGKVVVVEFWATWCRACIATHGDLTALARDEASRGLVVLGISHDERALIERYARTAKPGFTLLRDAEAKVQSAYWAGSIPTIIVIDRAGIVRHVGIGGGEDAARAMAAARKLARAPARGR